MATTLYSDFAASILPAVPGVPPPLVNTAVRQAAITFCRESGAWLETLVAIDSVALTDTYTLTSANANGVVRTVHTVHYDDVPLGMQMWEALRSEHPDHPDTANPSTPYKWAMKSRDVLSLFPVPETAVTGGIVVRCTVIPSMTSTGLDTDVAEDYEEFIIHGALNRLLIMPGKQWTEMKIGDYHGQTFRNGINVAKARMNKGFTNASLQVEYPRIVPTSASIRRSV